MSNNHTGNIQPVIDLEEHQGNLNAKRVISIDSGGNPSSSGASYAVEAQQDSTYEYYAFAPPGTSLASASWQAKRVESDGTTRWADGNANFDNVASNLAGLSYS